jgi:adenine deaminase
VALPNVMLVMWAMMNRVTRSGAVIGPDERLTPIEALKTITLWSAYQHFGEKSKGSLEAGKLADLVILDRNPLKGDPMTIKDITIVETIKEGRTVYRGQAVTLSTTATGSSTTRIRSLPNVVQPFQPQGNAWCLRNRVDRPLVVCRIGARAVDGRRRIAR